MNDKEDANMPVYRNTVDDCDHGEMEVEIVDGVRIGACPDCGLFLELEDADVLGEGV